MNPVNGGIPLNESNIIGIISWMIGDIVFSLLNWVLCCWLLKWIMMKRGIIIDEYII